MTAQWRITLTCGCVYVIQRAPDLRRPIICPQASALAPELSTAPQVHGLRSIAIAARIEQC